MLPTVQLGSTKKTTSCLGYGCSSLMGATGRGASLRLLGAAFDVGIRHFDTAPLYGFGDAEKVLGEFAETRRGEVTLVTKFGLPRPRKPALMAVARRLVGPVLKQMPALKKRATQAASAVAGDGGKLPFTRAEAERSLHESLRALRTDHVDLLLLHEAEASDLVDDDLLRFLEEAVTLGKVGAFGVGSEAARVRLLQANEPAYCGVVQHEWSVFDGLPPADGAFHIHHRSLTEKFHCLRAQLQTEPSRAKAWSDAAGVDLADSGMLAKLMLRAALVFNAGGIVLTSSKRREHIASNAETARDASLDSPARALYKLVRGSADPGWAA